MITIKDYPKFQHYKNRKPPWIKLYRDLLDDEEFSALSDFAARLLLYLWLIASESATPGRIDMSSKKIAWRLRLASNRIASIDKALKELELQEFIGLDSDMLAPCQQGAIPEGETEKERKKREWGGLFDDFYEAYPRKVKRTEAINAWGKIEGVDDGTIIAALELHKTTEEWTKDNGKFIPHPSTWLNGRRWEDEIESTPSTWDPSA